MCRLPLRLTVFCILLLHQSTSQPCPPPKPPSPPPCLGGQGGTRRFVGEACGQNGDCVTGAQCTAAVGGQCECAAPTWVPQGDGSAQCDKICVRAPQWGEACIVEDLTTSHCHWPLACVNSFCTGCTTGWISDGAEGCKCATDGFVPKDDLSECVLQNVVRDIFATPCTNNADCDIAYSFCDGTCQCAAGFDFVILDGREACQENNPDAHFVLDEFGLRERCRKTDCVNERGFKDTCSLGRCIFADEQLVVGTCVFVGDEAKWHYCPAGNPHPTAKCVTSRQADSLTKADACPYISHFCHRTLSGVDLCCPRRAPVTPYPLRRASVIGGGAYYPSRQIGQACAVDEQCPGAHLADPRGACDGGVCRCAPRFNARVDPQTNVAYCDQACIPVFEVKVGQICLPRVDNDADECSDSRQCTRYAEESECRENRCSCACGKLRSKFFRCIPIPHCPAGGLDRNAPSLPFLQFDLDPNLPIECSPAAPFNFDCDFHSERNVCVVDTTSSLGGYCCPVPEKYCPIGNSYRRRPGGTDCRVPSRGECGARWESCFNYVSKLTGSTGYAGSGVCCAGNFPGQHG